MNKDLSQNSVMLANYYFQVG